MKGYELAQKIADAKKRYNAPDADDWQQKAKEAKRKAEAKKS